MFRCSSCIRPVQFGGVYLRFFCLLDFVCLLFSWLRRFCLYLTTLTPLIWLTSIPLSANSQTIGCSLISRYWIFQRANTVVDNKPKAPARTVRFCVHISRGTSSPLWLNKSLAWFGWHHLAFYFTWQITFTRQVSTSVARRIVSDHCPFIYITWKSCRF